MGRFKNNQRQPTGRNRNPGHSDNMDNWPKKLYRDYCGQLRRSNAEFAAQQARALEWQARALERQAEAPDQQAEAPERPPSLESPPYLATRAKRRQYMGGQTQPIAPDFNLTAATVQRSDRDDPNTALQDLRNTLERHSKTACLFTFAVNARGTPFLDTPGASNIWGRI